MKKGLGVLFWFGAAFCFVTTAWITIVLLSVPVLAEQFRQIITRVVVFFIAVVFALLFYFHKQKIQASKFGMPLFADGINKKNIAYTFQLVASDKYNRVNKTSIHPGAVLLFGYCSALMHGVARVSPINQRAKLCFLNGQRGFIGKVRYPGGMIEDLAILQETGAVVEPCWSNPLFHPWRLQFQLVEEFLENNVVNFPKRQAGDTPRGVA